MRDWRKLHKNILTSKKIANISSDAFYLYIAIILHQDDRGLFPWDELKAQYLVVGRKWDLAFTHEKLKELEKNNLIKNHKTYLEIINHKNTNPYKQRPGKFYDLNQKVTKEEVFKYSSNKFLQVFTS